MAETCDRCGQHGKGAPLCSDCRGLARVRRAPDSPALYAADRLVGLAIALAIIAAIVLARLL